MNDRPAVQFGFFLTPSAANYPALLQQVRLCEQLGLDVIGIQDHPYQQRFFDTWTLMTALAAQTSTIRFVPDVINLPLRPPVMLAKAAASLDIISEGRVELGMGAGFFWEGITAMGGPKREPGEAVDALEEAVQIIRLVWSGQRSLKFEGQHYSVRGMHAGPAPAHTISIHIGAIQTHMLALTGRLGDGWLPSSTYVPPEKLAESNRSIDEAAEEAGRSPGSIRRLYNVMGSITGGESKGFLDGPAGQWVDELSELYTNKRMDTFIFSPAVVSEEQIRIFAEEVVPHVRDNLK
jgi:alkanesulfonate monooxygenase SsuD/methylene tetrahydromethanopterin reductase-like flavin-dependent oxidoreductase (luciferase family)